MSLCECGCGFVTPVAKRTSSRFGHVAGQHTRFCVGHTDRRGADSPLWKGGRTNTTDGYVLVNTPGRGRVMEHVLVAESVLGKPLPQGACVHHVNGTKDDNSPCNLVICEDAAYHNLLHRRQRALSECGHADWRRCHVCKQYDAPRNLAIHKDKWSTKAHHPECLSRVRRERRAAQRRNLCARG